jgi:hypothetical protein
LPVEYELRLFWCQRHLSPPIARDEALLPIKITSC